ncbi:hypothetical protein RBU60_13655 [Mesonia sp. MT50]|uniref:Uncharacterized protein n=1 Tax=Mesonia profundi TaxID=3070998 RepID=A0ABU1A4I8_9FLAO|nr:hypothetical protein [Mesonia profundi]MDQ7918619.1 hypothetical protein [Mesonia profundi]
MKKIIITALCLTFGLTNYAQTKDKLEKTVTTKTTVKNHEGEEVAIKKRKIRAQQQLGVENNNKTNQTVIRYKPQISSSTSFESEEDSFMIAPDRKGYVVYKMDGKRKVQYAVIRKMPEKEMYVLHTKEYDSFGYFDKEGNFVVGNYDPKADAVILKKYKINRPTR